MSKRKRDDPSSPLEEDDSSSGFTPKVPETPPVLQVDPDDPPAPEGLPLGDESHLADVLHALPTSHDPVEGKGFRLQCNAVHLTYKTNIPKQALLKFMEGLFQNDVKEFSICHEQSEGGYAHTHCYVKWVKKLDIKSCRKFDYQNLHPNIKRVVAAQHRNIVLKYHLKQDHEPLANYTAVPAMEELHAYVKVTPDWDIVVQSTAYAQLISTRLSYVKQLHGTYHNRTKSVNEHASDTWTQPLLDLESDKFLNRACVLTGPAGCGKTSFAKAHFKHPLVCLHLDDLKSIRAGYHDGVVFDDMSFTHLPATSIIHLLDVENTRSIHCRNTNARLPAGMPRMFTINNINQLFFDPESESQNDSQKYNYCAPEQLAAIERRYVRCALPVGCAKYYK